MRFVDVPLFVGHGHWTCRMQATASWNQLPNGASGRRALHWRYITSTNPNFSNHIICKEKTRPGIYPPKPRVFLYFRLIAAASARAYRRHKYFSPCNSRCPSCRYRRYTMAYTSLRRLNCLPHKFPGNLSPRCPVFDVIRWAKRSDPTRPLFLRYQLISFDTRPSKRNGLPLYC